MGRHPPAPPGINDWRTSLTLWTDDMLLQCFLNTIPKSSRTLHQFGDVANCCCQQYFYGGGLLGPRVALQSGQLRWNSISWYTLTKLELTTSLFHSLVRESGTRHTFATLSTCPYNIFVTEIGEWGIGRRASEEEDEHHLGSYSIKGTRTFEKFRHSFSSNKFFIGKRLSRGKLILGII